MVQHKIKLPSSPIGFIISGIIAPLVKYRLNSEFKIFVEKIKAIKANV
jgi:hypothetical protein